MRVENRLPYALLLVAAVTILWLLVDNKQPQPDQSIVADQLILDRLQELDKRLKSLETIPPPVTVSEANNAETTNDVKALLARINALEAREAEVIEKREAQSAMSAAEFEVMIRDELNQSAEREPPVAKAHFEAANSLSSSYQVELEDVKDIFESEYLPNTTLSSVECREGYCRMEYKVSDTIDSADKEIEENELLVKLGQKYGSGTKVFMDNSSANGSKEIYIEFPKEE